METIDKRKRNLVILVILFSLLIFLFEIIPGLFENVSLLAEYIKRTAGAGDAAEVTYRLKNAQSENHALKSALGGIVTEYEENSAFSPLLILLNDLAERSGLDIMHLRPGPAERQKDLWLQPVEIEMEGSFEEFYNFNRFLENSGKVITVKKCEIKKDKGKKLKITAQLDIYLNLSGRKG